MKAPIVFEIKRKTAQIVLKYLEKLRHQSPKKPKWHFQFQNKVSPSHPRGRNGNAALFLRSEKAIGNAAHKASHLSGNIINSSSLEQNIQQMATQKRVDGHQDGRVFSQGYYCLDFIRLMQIVRFLTIFYLPRHSM